MAEKISEDLSGRRQGNAMAGSQTETPRDGQSLHRDRTQAGFERQAHATYERQAARGGDHPQHRWDGAKLHDHLDLNACSQKGAIDELTDGAPWFEANERLPFEVMDCNRAPGQVVVDSGHQHDFVDAQLADVETSGRHGERDQTEFELVGADVEGYLATPALFHVEANARMQGLELGDSCRQQERRDRGAATHPDRPALEAEVLGDVLAEFVVAGGDAAASVDRLPAQIREFDPVATPHEQFGAQLGLELLEAPGQRGLTDVYPFGGVSDRARVGHGQKRSEQQQVDTCDYCMSEMQSMRFTQDGPVRTIRCMLDIYRTEAAERAAIGIPPLPLTAAQVIGLIRQLTAGTGAETLTLLDLLTHRVSPGVDDAAAVKAEFLATVARGEISAPPIGAPDAVALLGTMLGGYNVAPLVELLDNPSLGGVAAAQLAGTLLVFDAFHDVAARAQQGNPHAVSVMRSWASEDWFTRRPELSREIHLTVFRVNGEVNTDDLSPAPHASSRSDIPLHPRAFLSNRADIDDAVALVRALKAGGRPIVFVADVVGTGSSRKSAVNSLLWHIGDDIPFVPNKRRGGVVLGARIAPIFFNTLEDAGALPIECDVDGLATGDHIILRPHDRRIETPAGELIAGFALRSERLMDEVRAGGRVPLIIGRTLRDKARQALDLEPSGGRGAAVGTPGRTAYTLAQKIVGRACGTDGIAPGTYCEPTVSTVGSQDTTGPMNRSELEELACLGFAADLVLQTFCHTAAYPKAVDIETQRTLPAFMQKRGGVALRPGDGIIHSWLNQMLLPDQVGTGSDSHTRFPLGISFPAGSGLVAFAAALGVMPLDMPESVLVRFRGEIQPGITLRDLVQAIPYAARNQGLLTLGPTGGQNVFGGRIIEIQGLEHLTVERAFELTDSTAERSAAGCTIALSEETVVRHLRANVELLRGLVDAGYQDARTLERRALSMERWLSDPHLLQADADAAYAATIDIDMSSITEPLLACPNDPDDVRPLSEVAGRIIDEVFIGSCMTNVGHFRAAGTLLAATTGPVPTRLWMAPPTKMDEAQLRDEGYYGTYAAAGARTEIPGCSLCMGNQARVAPGATVVSTSTRNFANRMGQDAQVFLASAELAAVAAINGRLPSVDEYFAHTKAIETEGAGLPRSRPGGRHVG